MTKSDLTTVITPLIQMGQLQEVFTALTEYVGNSDRYIANDLLLQTASFNRNKRDFTSGLISKSDYDIAISRVNYALTQIIERLPETGNAISATPPKSPKEVTPMNNDEKCILFLTANPADSGRLNLQQELRKVKDGLDAASRRDDFKLESESAVRIPTITKAMQVHKPAIVHFSGHGTGEDGIVVEDEIGNQVLFPTAGVDRLFRLFRKQVKCVVLNACYSEVQAEVISKHGIYVVGMNEEIGDKAAVNFSVGFYQSIGEGNDFEFAYEIAMVNISSNLEDVAIPELWYNGKKILSP